MEIIICIASSSRYDDEWSRESKVSKAGSKKSFSLLTKMFAFSINCHRNGFFSISLSQEDPVLAFGKREHKYTFAYVLGSAKHIVM